MIYACVHVKKCHAKFIVGIIADIFIEACLGADLALLKF